MVSPEPEKLIDYLRRIVEDAKRIMVAAEEIRDYGPACAALREQARVIEILLKVAEARSDRDREQAAKAPMTDEDLEELVREATGELERRRVAA